MMPESASPAVRDTVASSNASRREVLRSAAGLGLTAAIGSLAVPAWAVQSTQSATNVAGSDVIRVGLIGCGGRGLGAVKNAVVSSEGVEIRAIGDVFEDQTQKARQNIEQDENPQIKAANKLTDETCFSGFDAYKKVIESDVDYVLIACPPYFHPMFSAAAVDAGKHVFCEKPGAIDAPGVRQLIQAGEKAAAQNTGFLAGTQRRHEPAFIETIQRVHNGEIGRLIYGEAFWNNRDWIVVPRQSGWSDMEAQIRNWRQNRWLSGDMPGVLVIHFLDVMNWAIGDIPESAYGTGGRIARTDPELRGNIYDHIEARLIYPGGQRVHAMTRTIPGVTRNSMFLAGSEGDADMGEEVRGKNGVYNHRKEHGRETSSLVLEHRDMIQSIRDGKPLNEARQLAEASLTSIMMRETAYSGMDVTRDFMLNKSQRRLGPDTPPDQLTFSAHEIGPVAIPGEWELL